MTSALRNTISELAASFASGVLNAIRGASLEEILSETDGVGRGARRGPGRPRGSTAAESAPTAGRPRGGRGRSGRLGRRSADDIEGLVDRIVSLLESRPEGLRAEQIREELGLEAKELPRPINVALETRRIGKQGQKRATTYFARGAGKGGSRGGGKRGGAAKKGRGPKRGRRGASAGGADQGEVSSSGTQ